MAIQRMKSPTPGNTDSREKYSITSGQTSDWIMVPSGMSHLGVELKPAGTAYVETSMDRDAIVAETATGIKWDAGDVSVDTQNVARGLVGIRFVSISGDADLHLNAVIGG